MTSHRTAASASANAECQRARAARIDYENAVAEFGLDSGEAMAARLHMGATLRICAARWRGPTR